MNVIRFEVATPFQFQSLTDYFDTLILTTGSMTPLDVAVPRGAGYWISAELGRRLRDRYRGRTAWMDGGEIAHAADPMWLLQAAEASCDIHLQAGLWITERRLLDETAILARERVRWLGWDWWQWLRRRVPENRLTDAIFFLCVGIDAYRLSPEYAALGMAEAWTNQAAAEGHRLWSRMEQAGADRLQTLWSEIRPFSEL